MTEQSTLAGIAGAGVVGGLVLLTEARAAFSPTAPIAEQAATSAATSQAVRSLLLTVESYPDLKSGGNVLALQEEIERLESIIADRRELYNDQVYRHNTRIGQVPGVLLGGLFGWTSRAFFDAEPGAATVPAELATGADAGDREGDPEGDPEDPR